MKHIIGHLNPDTDTICSALVYQDFLTQKGVEAKAYALGHLNNETKFIFKKFGVKEPEQINELPKGSEIILLDHNEESQSISNLKDLDIVEIIDHHKIKIETDKPISIYIEPLGSSCSIIAKKYLGEDFKNSNLEVKLPSEKLEIRDSVLSETNASLLIAGIISDTLFFRSPTTTQIDRDLVEELNKIAQIDDLEKFSLEMFTAKSDLGNISTEALIKLDYKVFEFGGNNYGIGVMETTNKDFGLNRKEEIKEKLREIKKKENLRGVFFLIIDILSKESFTFTSGNVETELFIKIFNAEEKEGFLFTKNLVSRKKQIVPKFQSYLNN